MFNLVALGNRGSPREVISVACEGPWPSKHTYYIIVVGGVRIDFAALYNTFSTFMSGKIGAIMSAIISE